MEGAIRGGDRTSDKWCQCLDVKLCFLKTTTTTKKITLVANDIRLTFFHFRGKYMGIYYLLHLSVLKVFLYLKCFLLQVIYLETSTPRIHNL